MYSGWTKNEIKEAWQRFYRVYQKNPVDYRFLCGHCIQNESDADALDYYIIGTWLVVHRKYGSWSKEKSFDLAFVLEFMQTYKITIPRYVRRTKFYREKMKQLLSLLNTGEVPMEINLKEFQRELAEHKVYDAWQYVNSLQEMLTYMDMSCALVEKVYAQRKERLHEKEQEILCAAAKNGSAEITEDALHCTDLNIAGIAIDDRLFLQKTTMEFFHYARTCIDILFQIINAALLGDRASKADDKSLVKTVNAALDRNDGFKNLKSLLDANKENDKFKYIQDFDNYIKHIKTVLITVKNSFLIGDQNEFTIRAFVNGQASYSEKDAVTTVRDSDYYIHETVVRILEEVKRQLPNCLDSSQRVHDVLYKLVVQESNNKAYPDYLSFFIEVKNDLSELKPEIKVLPLIVGPNGEIQSSDFRFDTIFIRKAGTDEFDIIGCAKIKDGFNTNELYRTFTVSPCDRREYIKYIGSFKQEHSKFHFSSKGMQGSIIVYKD